MEPIYDSTGAVCAWFYEENILNIDGNYAAFINGGSIISYGGEGHIGWFEDGVFWDSHFTAVGMLRDASAAIPRPGFGGVPGRPGRAGRPGRPGIPGTPGRPGRSNSWSHLSWSAWLPNAY